ncbi:short-chain dehydrogenase/reductase family protein [Fusarium sporotrichioides]|uniref:Short-chain dehydrogenase/reductase family protein n=1 Tax=Fusarium sporotrichioides TaxID=5514 RepID=A0A395RKE0_FUSSP|nr:short-chain dehydrogenase/reductase family protein [Fusarium sporotrichioides]
MPFIQPPVQPLPAALDFSGLTVMVTGATSGLGLEFSRQYLIRGASTLTLAVRDIAKGEKTKADLKADPEVQNLNRHADIRVMQFDAASYTSVKNVLDNANHELKRLHILMLNAGENGYKYVRTSDGHEQTIQVNHLANAALIFGLLPLLEQTGKRTGKQTRISVTGSRMSTTSPFCKDPTRGTEQDVLEYLDDQRNFQGLTRYGDSKLLILLFVHRLGKLYGSNEVIINNFCPGMVNTSMTKSLPWYIRAPASAIRSIRGVRKVEHGGWLGLNAAAVAGPESHGQLISDNQLEQIDSFYKSEIAQALEERIWNETIKDVAKVVDAPVWAKRN